MGDGLCVGVGGGGGWDVSGLGVDMIGEGVGGPCKGCGCGGGG